MLVYLKKISLLFKKCTHLFRCLIIGLAICKCFSEILISSLLLHNAGVAPLQLSLQVHAAQRDQVGKPEMLETPEELQDTITCHLLASLEYVREWRYDSSRWSSEGLDARFILPQGILPIHQASHSSRPCTVSCLECWLVMSSRSCTSVLPRSSLGRCSPLTSGSTWVMSRCSSMPHTW